MQQAHKGLCKHQGKARTARVPAQKLAAPRQNHLLPPLAQAPVRTQAAAGSHLLSSGCLPTAQSLACKRSGVFTSNATATASSPSQPGLSAVRIRSSRPAAAVSCGKGSEASLSKLCPLQGESAPTLGPGSTGRQRAAGRMAGLSQQRGGSFPFPCRAQGSSRRSCSPWGRQHTHTASPGGYGQLGLCSKSGTPLHAAAPGGCPFPNAHPKPNTKT